MTVGATVHIEVWSMSYVEAPLYEYTPCMVYMEAM